MKRTYRSKKSAGDGLDHKYIFPVIDRQSSDFDAFYIKNIKQAKKDLSCMGASTHSGVAPYKICKKKYVKRVVKDSIPEQTPPRNSHTYLTPDKSLHVNKLPDAFDLLIKAPTELVESPKLQRRPQEKKYGKKKIAKAKKINYSSSENSTDFDKENNMNACSNWSQNVSDIKSYELIIEKEDKPIPKCDKSIYNVEKKIYLIGNSKSDTYKRNCLNTHRLTTTNNLKSPFMHYSPICSTPLNDKSKNKLIDNFSPIINDLYDCPETPNSTTNTTDKIKSKNGSGISKENNESLLITSSKKNDNYSLKCQLSTFMNTDEDNKSKPNVDIPNKNDIVKSNFLPIIEAKDGYDFSSLDGRQPNESGVLVKNDDSIQNFSVNVSSQPFIGFSKVETEDLILKDRIMNILNLDETIECANNNANHVSLLETSKREDNISVMDCFIIEEGVSSNCVSCTEDNKSILLDNVNCDIKTNISLNVQNISLVADSSHNPLCFSEDESHKLNLRKKFSNISEAEGNNNCDKNDSTEYEINNYNNSKELNDLAFDCSISQHNSYSKNCSQNIENTSVNNLNTSKHYTSSNTLYSKSIDSESMYGTCSSEESFNENCSIDNFDEETRYRLRSVILDSMCDKSFSASQGKNPNFMLDSYNSFNVVDRSTSLFEVSCSNEVSCNEIDNCRSDAESSEMKSIYEPDNSVQDEKCISYVNTRRRRGVLNDSLLPFDNSFDSINTLDIDKTAVNRNNHEPDKFDYTLNQDSTSLTEEVNYNKTSIQNNGYGNSNVSLETNVNEKSPRCQRVIQQEADTSVIMRPPIVLQPGKKWERSLSIYKRITIMADSFDHSILDNEPIQNKGRNYRQSVLNTMEIQKLQGSLQNESINSRRSTIISKPRRSTFRLAKEDRHSHISLCSTVVYEDLKGFLSDDCDDTIIELSKLSIGDSDHEVTVLEKFHDTSRITSARDFVLRRCNQTEAILFDECYPDTELKNCHKIGEGVYGEVFLWRARDGRARVLKVIPIDGDIKVNGEQQKSYQEIVSEIVIAMELSALRTPIDEIERHLDEGKDIEALDLHSVENATDVFNEVLAVRCVQGSYPSRLLDLWDLYDECKGSENDNPAVLPVDQHYIVLELANAGQDLESYQFNSAEQAHALFYQVAFGLAVGEEAFQFEHRDLHWGNVLIAPTEQKWATFVLRGRAHRVARCGVAATVIDYSLSRVSLRGALYSDLARDEALFDAVGDYQFQVYRLMRDKLGNDWKNFEPYTNILWLHYTVDKMITALRYKRTNTKIHKHYIAKLKAIKNRILDYGSASQFVLTYNE